MRYLLLDEDKEPTQEPSEIRYILVESRGESERIFFAKLCKTLQILQVNEPPKLTSQYLHSGIYVGEINRGGAHVYFSKLVGAMVRTLKISMLVKLYNILGDFYYVFIQEENK